MMLAGRTQLTDSYPAPKAVARMRQHGFEAWSYSCHADYLTNAEVLTRTIRPIELTGELGTDVFVFSGRPRDKRADLAQELRALDGPAAFDLDGHDYESILPGAISHVQGLLAEAGSG